MSIWLAISPQAALDNSLPIKRAETGLKHVVLWGRILTRSGKVRSLSSFYVSSMLARLSFFCSLAVALCC